METIITPLMIGMANEGRPYKGVLFAGLMITEQGPKVIEFNVRFGDPECQVLMMRLGSDILPLLEASASGTLSNCQPVWKNETALTVVMAAEGYPGSYEKNTVIRNLDQAGKDDHVTIFHAGTARSDVGELVATGGRVLNVTARGTTVTEAQSRAYEAVDQVEWPEGFVRRDIGWRAVAREQESD